MNSTLFNEDMIYAATAMDAGYAVAYVPEAKVVHSHNLTPMQQFHRNFDLVIQENEFVDMKNMSSDAYPAISVRQARGPEVRTASPGRSWRCLRNMAWAVFPSTHRL